jgi:hypothetical protein
MQRQRLEEAVICDLAQAEVRKGRVQMAGGYEPV